MLACTWPSKCLKPRANGRNIFGQQLPTLLDVTCCVRLYTLLHVVGYCCAKFETGQTFQPTTPNISFVPWSPKRSVTMLDLFAQLFQHCCSRTRSLGIVYKDLWVDGRIHPYHDFTMANAYQEFLARKLRIWNWKCLILVESESETGSQERIILIFSLARANSHLL